MIQYIRKEQLLSCWYKKFFRLRKRIYVRRSHNLSLQEEWNGGKEMYWEMPRFEIARQKAAEVLSKLHYNPAEMIRTNDIIKAVEEMLDVDVRFSKYDFSQLAGGAGKASSIADCGAMMFVSQEDGKRRASVLLNERETPEMVRFSLVHELGHLMTMDWERLEDCHISTHIDMDITSIPEAALQDPNLDFLVEEQIANIFALLVLIPYNSLIGALSKYDSTEEVANFFGVERSAVISRLMLEKK